MLGKTEVGGAMAINIWTASNHYSYRIKLTGGKQHKNEIIIFKLLSENIAEDHPKCFYVRNMENHLDAMYVTLVILEIQDRIFL